MSIHEPHMQPCSAQRSSSSILVVVVVVVVVAVVVVVVVAKRAPRRLVVSCFLSGLQGQVRFQVLHQVERYPVVDLNIGVKRV